jgi:hypothetical protein
MQDYISNQVTNFNLHALSVFLFCRGRARNATSSGDGGGSCRASCQRVMYWKGF